MIFCKELNKEFADKKEMFKALKANESALITLKKKEYKGCEKRQLSFLNLDAVKLAGGIGKAGFDIENGYIYPVISTTKYRDSHGDVHFDGCFTKTVKEQQGRVMYALDHKLEFDSVIAWPKDVQMIVSNIDWSLVGKNYPGQTEALIFKIAKSAVRADVLEAIETRKADFENSIRMVYYKIKLAINSTEKDLSENKAYYDSRIDDVANKEEVEEDGYFWGVEELGIHKEGSLVVGGGSNDATSIILSEAAQSTAEKTDPPLEQSKTVKQSNYYNTIH